DQWTALGVPMTNVDDIGVDARFGRVELIQAHGPNTTYCMPTEWSDPPATAIDGSSVQLARVDPPLSVVLDVLPFSAVSVDASERCATWTGEGGQVILDLDDGDELELAIGGAAIWLQ
ncbi:MAG TPA: hypothetical protein VK034_28095, partial [Enhygromyxa sp.]|nr:hypothetical protein [Enhygromyxa sp.]